MFLSRQMVSEIVDLACGSRDKKHRPTLMERSKKTFKTDKGNTLKNCKHQPVGLAFRVLVDTNSLIIFKTGL